MSHQARPGVTDEDLHNTSAFWRAEKSMTPGTKCAAVFKRKNSECESVISGVVQSRSTLRSASSALECVTFSVEFHSMIRQAFMNTKKKKEHYQLSTIAGFCSSCWIASCIRDCPNNSRIKKKNETFEAPIP